MKALLKYVLILLVVGCSRDTETRVAGEVAAAKGVDPSRDPNSIAAGSIEYRRNASFREQQESQIGTPLSDAKFFGDSDRELVYRGKFAGTLNFVVSLWRDGALVCTGSLIEPTLVLSAWHCLCSSSTSSVPKPPDEVRVGPLGMLPIDSIPVRSVSPAVCPRSRTEPDLAMIRLWRPPTQAISIRYPVVRDLPGALPAITVVGYGFREDRGRNRRDMAVVTIASRECATEADRLSYGCLARREFVAVDPKGQVDACNGDSGGPALVPFSMASILGSPGLLEFDDSYELVGVVSRGVTERCGSGTVYGRAAPLPQAPL